MIPASPSQLSVLTQNFLAHFLACFANESGRFWMQQLPSMQTVPTVEGLELSIQAASMAYCATAASNPAFLVGSKTIYSKALQAHSKSVALIGDTSTPSPQNICTAIMLAFYEVISSSDEGYIHHMNGAARMLHLLGPMRCRDGLANELFFTLKTLMVSQASISH
jgi:hypothetical protein